MKLILKLACYLGFCNAIGQTVFLPNIGTKWTYLYSTHGDYMDAIYNLKTEYIKDSVYNGESIKVLRVDRIFTACNNLGTQLVYIKQRNDSVWFLGKTTGYTWQLFFDFGATVGQKWTTTTIDFTTSITHTITVSSITTTVMNAVPIKQINVQLSIFSPVNTINTVNTIIYERIGYYDFLFPFVHSPPFACDDDFLRSFICYQDSTLGTKTFSSYDCKFSNPVGMIPVKAESGMKLYPNPISDKLNLEVGPELFSSKITVINAFGQVIYESSILKPKQEIDMSIFAAGVYFLKIQNSSGQKVLKVLKE